VGSNWSSGEEKANLGDALGGWRRAAGFAVDAAGGYHDRFSAKMGVEM
jgi:hypothetical protein